MKKLLLIVIPLLVIGGGSVVGLAMSGKIKIAGLTPKNLMADKPKVDAKATKTAEPKKAAPPKDEPPADNPAKGQSALAKLWNEIDTAKLKEITATWKVSDLAPVLMKMDEGKVSEFIAELEAKRASEVSQEIQKLASKPVG